MRFSQGFSSLRCMLGVLGVGACASAANGPDQAFNIDLRYPITVEPRMMISAASL